MVYRQLMTITPTPPAPVTVRAGRPSWRVAVVAEADRLETQLNAALAKPAEAPNPDPAAVASIQQAINQARDIAIGKTGWHTLGDWWFGTSIESSWQALHRADEQLVTVQPTKALLAMRPHLESLATATFSGTRAAAENKAMEGWSETEADAQVAQRILNAHHAQSDINHQQIRGLRNLLYIFFAAVAAIDCALWAAGVTAGAVVGLGALAGAVSVAFAIRAGTPSGPYNLLPAQSLLKVATGAATAIMAAKILDFTSNVQPSTARDGAYAIIFGFSQQAFTRLVDQRASDLSKGPNARSGQGAVTSIGQAA